MYVQIGSTAWKGEPGKPDTGLEVLPGAGTCSELPRAWAGEFVDLSRDQINHLIKQLRAARDQAYGRDE
jgi:redox-sensitive bicupin YhaK (pirin superfamily)